MRKGKFIVFEGTDGSGKGTQVQLLVNYLTSKDISNHQIEFPRYKDNPYGELISRYLKGEFGGIERVDNQLISLAFAGDRMLAKTLIEKYLKSGILVIADRYVPSNKAHMGARIEPILREQFIEWLDNLEYKVNQIPKEDLVVFLHVPSEIAQQNVKVRGKGHDLHEKDLQHLRVSNEIYHQLAKKNKNWVVVDCVQENKMKSKEEIHQEVVNILKERHII